jgi:hypothetical protein
VSHKEQARLLREQILKAANRAQQPVNGPIQKAQAIAGAVSELRRLLANWHDGPWAHERDLPQEVYKIAGAHVAKADTPPRPGTDKPKPMDPGERRRLEAAVAVHRERLDKLVDTLGGDESAADSHTAVAINYYRQQIADAEAALADDDKAREPAPMSKAELAASYRARFEKTFSRTRGR